MKNLHLTILVCLLCAVGMGVFLYKVNALGFPLLPQTRIDIWKIEAKVSFQAQNRPVKISLNIPKKSGHFDIVNENFISRGYGINTKFEEGNRVARWSIRKADGHQSLYYQSAVRILEKKEEQVKTPVPEVVYHGFEEAEKDAADAFIAEIRDKSADMETFVAELFRRLSLPRAMENFTPIVQDVSTEEMKLNLAVRLLSLSGFPARAVHGILLEGQRNDAPLIHWLEYYEYNRWVPFDPRTGSTALDEKYLVWWRGPWSMLSARGVKDARVSISVNINQEEGIFSAVERGKIRKPLMVTFSLFSLPVQTQMVFRVLLLVPIGVFFLVIMRNMIGVKTFGTFMPVLIALAFRETQLVGGIILFTLLVCAGMSIRLYLEHLKLLVVPRLAAVLIVVILLMISFSIVMHKLDIERGLSVALFPMVIMTMIIERISIVWEELGPPEAIQQGLGTLAVAALSYMVMRIATVEHMVFVFPELLLVLLAATLLMGRYSGYRLVELWRFRDILKKK